MTWGNVLDKGKERFHIFSPNGKVKTIETTYGIWWLIVYKLSVGFNVCFYLACLTSCSCSIAIVVHLLVSNHVLHEEYKILQRITSKFLPMVSGTHWVLSVFLLQNGRFVWTSEIWMILRMIFFHTRYLNNTYIEREWEYYNLLQHKDQSPLGGDWTTEDDKKRQNISNNLIRYWS